MSDTQLTLLIIFGVVLALVVLVTVFRTRSGDELPAPEAGEEGHAPSDGFAAAVEDVVGEFVGVEANPDTPGDDTVRRDPNDGSGGVSSTSGGGAGDDLTQIKGLGPKASKGLIEMGVKRFEQIAGWTEGDIDTVGEKLGGSFAQRIRRERWTEQAGLLARGEIATFEETFGKIG